MTLVQQHGVMVAVMTVVDTVWATVAVGPVTAPLPHGQLVVLLLPQEGVLEAVQVVPQVLLVQVVEGVSSTHLTDTPLLRVGQIPSQGHLARDPPSVFVFCVSLGVVQLLPE